jgi:V-type H+-transporting ATPase subunit F
MGKKKFLNQTDMKIGLIGDEDTVTGMVLAGIGHVDGAGKKNFLLVDAKTHRKDMAEKFQELTMRKDISMIFITQSCADMIRDVVDSYTATGQVIPSVLEIPSKEHPYDPRQDNIMRRVAVFMPTAMQAMGIEA